MTLKLTKLELKIIEALWRRSPLTIRKVQEAFPKNETLAYAAVQTTLYRLEGKKALRRVRKMGNAHIFEPVLSRSAALRRLVDDFFGLSGGRMQPVMARLIEFGKLTLDDVREAGRTLRALEKKGELK